MEVLMVASILSLSPKSQIDNCDCLPFIVIPDESSQKIIFPESILKQYYNLRKVTENKDIRHLSLKQTQNFELFKSDLPDKHWKDFAKKLYQMRNN